MEVLIVGRLRLVQRLVDCLVASDGYVTEDPNEENSIFVDRKSAGEEMDALHLRMIVFNIKDGL